MYRINVIKQLNKFFPYNFRYYSTEKSVSVSNLRNVSIIAHVDHGKTTLVDELLKQSYNPIDTNDLNDRVMDSNDLEKERGITILSKCTALHYESSSNNELYRFNIVDTPGHADFGGEVERVMSMIDGVALVVDATDGPMTQTRFVLQKALQHGLKPFVIINKVDRPSAKDRLGIVENEIFDLFDSLGATDEQLDFPFLYASAIEGWCVKDNINKPIDQMKDLKIGMTDLFETIIDHVSSPQNDANKPFSMLISQIDTHPFFGTTLTGRIESGIIKEGDIITAKNNQNEIIEQQIKIPKILCRRGLEQQMIAQAYAGDIVSIPGLKIATVTDTLMHSDQLVHNISAITIDPPTISMIFSANKSPLAGKEGKKLTPQAIAKRLHEEVKSNVALKIKPLGDSIEVYGRGELHLAILIETMRREHFELSVSAPNVIYKKDKSYW